jgi:putative glutamine amidotransferase
MSSSSKKPLVGVISDCQLIEPHVFHTAGDKYLRALSQASQVAPVILPSLLADVDIEQWLSRLDGVFLTGAYSMVDPALYGEEKTYDAYGYDEQRDSLAKALVDAVIAANIPIFGVCRGLQDMNVALGGSLYQAVQDVAGMDDHRENKDQTLAQQYGDAHSVTLAEGGLLSNIIGDSNMTVNSLHSQGIAELGRGLTIEATAPDGLVEAISVASMDFGLAVQWHPEWQVMNNPQQKRLFEAFGDACRARQSK